MDRDRGREREQYREREVMSSGYAVADREGGRGEEERARGEIGRAGKNSPDVSPLRGGRA